MQDKINKKYFLIEFSVNEKEILEKYPNYKFNWDDSNDFIKDSIESIIPEDSSYGFDVKIKSISHKKANQLLCKN
jgi:hypothetical protein